MGHTNAQGFGILGNNWGSGRGGRVPGIAYNWGTYTVERVGKGEGL